MPNTREKLIELIGSVEYGNGSLIGKNFQRGFVEKIADHLIANGVTVNEWISVKDRLPDKNGFLVADKDGYVGEAYLQDGKIYWMCDDCNDFWRDVKPVEVTHWMPLPQPPKGE